MAHVMHVNLKYCVAIIVERSQPSRRMVVSPISVCRVGQNHIMHDNESCLEKFAQSAYNRDNLDAYSMNV